MSFKNRLECFVILAKSQQFFNSLTFLLLAERKLHAVILAKCLFLFFKLNHSRPLLLFSVFLKTESILIEMFPMIRSNLGPLVHRSMKPTTLPTCAITCAPINAPYSVTRLGDLLDFGQLFKAFGNN